MRLTKCRVCKYEFFIKKENKEKWMYEGQPCPNCNEKYSTKPKTERELFILQEQILPKKDKRQLIDEFSVIIFNYTQSLILKYYPSYLDTEKDLLFYTANAVSFFMEDFLSRPNFKIYTSFAGFLLFKIKQSVFNKFHLDMSEETIDWQFDDNHYAEYSSEKSSLLTHIDNTQDRLQLLNYLYQLILNFNYDCSSKEDFIRLIAIDKYLNQGEAYADCLFKSKRVKGNLIKQYKTYNKEGKYRYMKTVDLIRKELLKWALN